MRTCSLLSSLLLVLLLLPACDGPGGSGGGGVPFTPGPTPGGDAGTDGETSAGTGGDAGDVGPTSETTGGDCFEGEVGCVSGGVATCANGQWSTPTPCPEGTSCQLGQCQPDDVCTPQCGECGPDGCGGTCGECPGGFTCAGNTCVAETCTPQCAGKSCGSDGCGGTCGTCQAGQSCTAQGQCEGGCEPDCGFGKECGDDGCGGTCGTCPGGYSCVGGMCQDTGCTPSCSGKQCGDDGCGGSCGTCGANQSCIGGLCQGSSGGSTCNEIISCLGTCADAECQNACVAAGSSAAQNEFVSLNDCLASCQGGATDCAAASCSDEYAGCIYEGTSTGSCSDIIFCLQNCPQNDEACSIGCGEIGTAQAQATYLAGNICILAYCPEAEPTCVDSAITGACATYVNACN